MIVFTACDSKYFVDHGKTLIRSCLNHGHRVHVHVVRPSKEVEACLEGYDPGSFQYTVTRGSVPNDRCYYACSRFLVLPYLLEQSLESFLVVDTDSFFMRPFDEIPEEREVGIFLREPTDASNEWERRGMRCAAGMVYVTPSALEFARSVRDRIVSMGTNRWFVDQVALYEAYEEHYSDTPEKVFFFNQRHLDWEFTDESIVWTGKGPRKHNSMRYNEVKDRIGI